MFKSIFETPIWVVDCDPAKIELTSKNFKNNWLSGTPSSFSQNPEDNVMTQDGTNYLKQKILNCLEDLNIADCEIFQIWRNIYNGDFQERHVHVNSNFSFTVYEELTEPQTIFYHPAHDLIYATGVEEKIIPYYAPEVTKNQMILFPSYLEHLVKKSVGSMTISGNVRLK